MARRRVKKRTHVAETAEDRAKTPRSMVLRLGTNLKNHSLTQLVRDMRNVMQPHTAIRLQERKSNKLKDFVVMAGPLNVSHLMIFSQSESGNTSLRIGRIPRGPTLTFKVENYSLCKDVHKIQRRPKSISKDAREYLTPPLLVLNGFTNPQTATPEEKLLITTLQNLFPPIQPQSINVNTVKRVLMVNKDKETGQIDLRHYLISTKNVEGSKPVKKLLNVKEHLNKRLPNLNKVADAADLLLDPYANGAGFTSDSEVEEDSIVDIKEDSSTLVSHNSKHAKAAATPAESAQPAESNIRKKAIKLTELGPRLKLSLNKIEEGICQGKVLYHSSVKKSAKELKALEQKHAERLKAKEQRKQEQQANIAQKKAKKEAKKERRKLRQAGEAGGAQKDDQDDQDDQDDDEDIPEDLDSDLYSELDSD